jgi:hypothetical protein
MTPKEKAKDLFSKFFQEAPYQEIEFYSNDVMAKQCALISVNEILNIDNIKPYILHKEIIEFYQEVKKEIEKL